MLSTFERSKNKYQFDCFNRHFNGPHISVVNFVLRTKSKNPHFSRLFFLLKKPSICICCKILPSLFSQNRCASLYLSPAIGQTCYHTGVYHLYALGQHMSEDKELQYRLHLPFLKSFRIWWSLWSLSSSLLCKLIWSSCRSVSSSSVVDLHISAETDWFTCTVKSTLFGLPIWLSVGSASSLTVYLLPFPSLVMSSPEVTISVLAFLSASLPESSSSCKCHKFIP